MKTVKKIVVSQNRIGNKNWVVTDVESEVDDNGYLCGGTQTQLKSFKTREKAEEFKRGLEV